MRAGEAKLCVCVSDDSLLAGPSKCEFRDSSSSSSPSRAVCAQFLLLFAWILSTFDMFLRARAVFLLLYTWVLSDVDYEYTVIAAMHMVFKRCCV